MTKILIASDHAGFEMKQFIKEYLLSLNYEVKDFGPDTYDANDDYPKYIVPLAEKVSEFYQSLKMKAGDNFLENDLSKNMNSNLSSDQEKVMGIVLGRSGEGEAIACNRFSGVRAIVYYGGQKEIIRLSREHNDSNILSLGSAFIDKEEIKEVVKLWLETSFSGEERHQRRNRMLDF